LAKEASPFANALYVLQIPQWIPTLENSILSDVGRQGDLNRTLLHGNPATDFLVKQYFTTTAEILARSVANFYRQYADRHINL